jgi:hypothetical protein
MWEEKVKEMLEVVRGLKDKVEELESELVQERTKEKGEHATTSGMLKKVLDKGTLANMKRYVQKVMFEKLKFLNDETLENHPQIMTVIWERLAIEDDTQKIEYKDDVVKEMKRDFSHRRSYCRKLIMMSYKSKKGAACDEKRGTV